MSIRLLKILLLNEENLWDISLISKVWFITILRQNLWAFAGVNKSLTVTPSASSLDNALRIHKELYKKDLHDPDNQNDVITHLEPDILECEVKWALGSIIMKKLMEVIEFQLSYFKSWKMMLWKCCTQHASKFGKLSSSHRTGKGQFSFQCQRKAMPKNAQTITQLHSSHMLAK